MYTHIDPALQLRLPTIKQLFSQKPRAFECKKKTKVRANAVSQNSKPVHTVGLYRVKPGSKNGFFVEYA